MSLAATKPDSEPGSESTSLVDYSSASDVDLAIILYVQNIPIVLTNKQEELDGRIESIRTSYRAKVVTVHRGESTWLSMASTTTHSSKATAGEDKINLFILRTLLDAIAFPNSSQALNVVKAVGNDFNGLAQTVQPHVFYIIDYYHDDVRDVVATAIKSFSFNVTVTQTTAQTAPPAKSGGGFFSRDEAVALPKGNFYEAAIEYTNTSASFDFDLWNKNAPKNEAPCALGKRLLVQKQLWLLKGSQ